MKRISQKIALVLLLAISIAFVSCKDENDNSNESNPPVSTINDEVTTIRSYLGMHLNDVLVELNKRNWHCDHIEQGNEFDGYEHFYYHNSNSTNAYEIAIDDSTVIYSVYHISDLELTELKTKFLQWEDRINDFGLNGIFLGSICVYGDGECPKYDSRELFLSDFTIKQEDMVTAYACIDNDSICGIVDYNDIYGGTCSVIFMESNVQVCINIFPYFNKSNKKYIQNNSK